MGAFGGGEDNAGGAALLDSSTVDRVAGLVAFHGNFFHSVPDVRAAFQPGPGVGPVVAAVQLDGTEIAGERLAVCHADVIGKPAGNGRVDLNGDIPGDILDPYRSICGIRKSGIPACFRCDGVGTVAPMAADGNDRTAAHTVGVGCAVCAHKGHGGFLGVLGQRYGDSAESAQLRGIGDGISAEILPEIAHLQAAGAFIKSSLLAHDIAGDGLGEFCITDGRAVTDKAGVVGELDGFGALQRAVVGVEIGVVCQLNMGAGVAIDQMIGYLQAKQSSGNACQTLRNLFLDYQKRLPVYRNQSMSDLAYESKKEEITVAQQQKVLGQIDEKMRNNFRVLSNYFKAGEISLERWLNELIPDAKLRPFLTPTSGAIIPEGHDYTVLHHNGITELILRCNLREVFQDKGSESEKNSTDFDEDYEYYAHFALVNTDGGKVKAICSWGGFYDYYASQSSKEQETFLADLEAKKYPRLLYLLTQSEYRFEKVNGIGGFSIETDIDYTNDIDAMSKAVAKAFSIQYSTFNILVAAAVELWKGTRLLVWRQLLQRYVLLHKVPVIDQPQYESKG